jgi:hypothetical protein
METLLPAIPAKRYFTIGEVSELCAVKPHVLYEQGFTISGARNRLQEIGHEFKFDEPIADIPVVEALPASVISAAPHSEGWGMPLTTSEGTGSKRLFLLRRELFEIRELLSEAHA